MTSFCLKIIACITMFIDHVGYLVFKVKQSFFNYIGRISFPIFAFQIGEGYTHTKNLKKYLFRLLAFAIISQIPFYLYCNQIFNNVGLNVFFTLLFGLISIIIYDKLSNKMISIPLCICLAFIAEFAGFDYGFYGVIVVLLFYIFRNKKLLMNLAFILSTLIKYGYYIAKYKQLNKFPILCVWTISSLIFINLYNKKQGKKIKYFLYIFYPVHLLIFYFLWKVLYL